MAYFTEDYPLFFRELAANNEKPWFDANRKRYEKNIREPFHSLVADMIIRINADDPDVMITSKEAIFRINRDIRFSADKRPYKTHMSAVISPEGRKNKTYPGFYFQVGAEQIMIAGGAHMVEKDTLTNIRHFIAPRPAALSAALNDPNFSKKYGTLQGEKNKRLPPEFRDAAASQPLLYNKQFFYSAQLPAVLVTRDDLGDVLMEYYQAGKPVMTMLRKAYHYSGIDGI